MFGMPTRPIKDLCDRISIDDIARQIVTIIAEIESRRLVDGMKAMGFDAVEE